MKRLLTLALPLAAMTLACSPPSANDLVMEVMAQRNNYTADLQSFAQRPDGTLRLDVMVVNNNQEGALRTLTVLVRQFDADNNVIDESRHAMDVAALTPGLGQPVALNVPGAAEVVEGALVIIERQVDEGLWPDFPEFDAVRPRI